MADPAARKLLTQLIQCEGLNNKVCCDCNNPNPQWASLRYADTLLDDTDSDTDRHPVSLCSCVCNVLVHTAVLAYISGESYSLST